MTWQKLCVLAAVIIAVAMVGCDHTDFRGEPHVEGGAEECESRCAEEGLEMAGMVMMGEYTDGCVCAVPGSEEQALQGAGSVAGGIVGVARQQAENESSAAGAAY